MSGFELKLNIQNCVNLTGNCVHYMYGMSSFAEKLCTLYMYGMSVFAENLNI